MKKIIAIVILIFSLISLWSDLRDFWHPQYLDILSIKAYQESDQWPATIESVSSPVNIMSNYYDLSLNGLRSKTFQYTYIPNSTYPEYSGHWFVFSGKLTDNSSKRSYNIYIDTEEEIHTLSAISANDTNEDCPSLAISQYGRPISAFHDSFDHDSASNLVFAYDAVIGGIALGMVSSALPVFQTPFEIPTSFANVTIEDLVDPIIQIGPSPLPDHQRLYICGQYKNSDSEYASGIPVFFYKDFTENELEYQVFNNSGFERTTILEISDWFSEEADVIREPYMAFRVIDDKLYYVGYHFTKDESIINDVKVPHEASIDVFVCDNYGQGLWQRYSMYDTFTSYNPNYIDPIAYHQGNPLAREFFDDENHDYNDDDFFIGIGESTNFNVGIDNNNRLHIPALFTMKTYDGFYYPELHTVKEVIFDPFYNEFSVVDIYPRKQDNYFSIDNNANNLSNEKPWLWWDADGDGIIDEIRDDGTWDGIDDNVTPEDSDYWGRPVLQTIWPFQYWDDNQGNDNYNLKDLNHLSITDANDEGFMALIWHDTNKSRFYHKRYHYNQSYQPYAEIIETMISISGWGNSNWSKPVSLNSLDYPGIAEGNPTFVQVSDNLDNQYFWDLTSRLFLAYNDDTAYGSSVIGIGPESEGYVKQLELTLSLDQIPTNITSHDVESKPLLTINNYPNPFNPETTISYQLKESANIKIDIYNLKGQKVTSLFKGNQVAGQHQIIWNGKNHNNQKVSSGIYLLRLSTHNTCASKKMILLK